MKLLNSFLVVLLLIGTVSHAAGTSDAVDDSLITTASVAQGIPDNNWCMTGWVQPTNGSSISASPSRLVRVESDLGDWNIAITSGGMGTAYDELTWDSDDDDGTAAQILPTNSVFSGVTSERLVGVQRSTNTITIFIGTFGNDVTIVGSLTDANYDAVISGGAFTTIFNRGDSNDRGLNGSMREWAFWSGVDCGTMLNQFTRGKTPRSFPTNRIWYLPMLYGPQELQAGIAFTNTSITFGPNSGPTIQ